MSAHDRLRSHLQALVGERHPFTSSAKLKHAEQYLADQFLALGLEVQVQAFEALGGTYHNVIGIHYPSKSSGVNQTVASAPLIVAAHYDTVPGSPGADDNASGLAVLLEAARLVREVPLASEVRFIGFCLEEEDLLGSLAYTEDLEARGEMIRGALVLECVGYACSSPGSQVTPPGTPIPVPSTGDFLALVGNTASADLLHSFERALNVAVPALKTVSLAVPGNGEILPDTRRSDHAAFWARGYPALMLTDTANFRNPHYHRPSDTIETLDLMFVEQVAVGLSSGVIELAGTGP